MVRGWTVTFGKHGKPVCPQCTALAPNPDTDNFNQWLAKHPGLDAYLRNNEVACAEPITEKTVYQVARRMFHSVTKTQPYTVTPPSLIPLKRRMKAYAVDHAEPGRVRQLMSTNGGNHHGSTVVPGTTPTQPQGADP